MKLILITITIVALLLIIFQSYLILAQTETQQYKVIKTEEEYEIRLYPSTTMASVTMNATSYKELASPGFRKLANYIFGGNKSKTNIAMTTPVHMNINDTGSSMSFVMPSEYTSNNLPQPNDSSVSIFTSEEEFVAVTSFGGFANDELIKSHAQKLENALKANKIEYYGNFRFLGYNAPYQIVGRKNEIIVSVKWNPKTNN
jgi:uncharacterized protein YxeA